MRSLDNPSKEECAVSVMMPGVKPSSAREKCVSVQPCACVCVPYLGCAETCKQMPSVFSPSPTATYLHVLIKEFRSPSNRFKESGCGSSRSGWHTQISGLVHFPVLYYSLQNNLLYLGIKGSNLGALLRAPRTTCMT